MKSTTEENSFTIKADHHIDTGKPIWETVVPASICQEIEDERDELKRELAELRYRLSINSMERELNGSTLVPPAIYDASIIAWNYMTMHNIRHLGPVTSRAYAMELEAKLRAYKEAMENSLRRFNDQIAMQSWERITP